jgi:hypothetical protein
VPLIGVVALGGEAGSWYVTKQHAQNAADAAAYSGGLRLRCSKIAAQPGGVCTDTNSVDYRAKQSAAQNAFCNAGDTSYLGSKCTSPPTGTSRAVQIDQPTPIRVRAIVSQQQPAYLAKVLGLSTVNIGATAIAEVGEYPKLPCILALKGSVDFQGSPTVSSPSCGIASNSPASNAIGFTGNGGLDVDVPTYAVGGCSQTGGNQCDNVTTYAAPVPNPLSGLDSAMSSLKTSDFSGKKMSGSSYDSYEKCGCYNGGNKTLTGSLNGTYFFTGGKVDIGNVTGTATLVLFGNATLSKITGNPTITLTAQTNPQVPPALSSVSSLMKDLLIYDPEPYSNKGVELTGDSSSVFNGIVYVPNTPVTFQGNSSVSAGTRVCFQLIAYAVTFSGNTNLDNRKCIDDGAEGAFKPNFYVRLVQ